MSVKQTRRVAGRILRDFFLNARRQLQGFNTRFQAMKETCKYCHGTERKYYVDESVQVLVGKLGQALSGSSIDPKMVEALTQEIGRGELF